MEPLLALAGASGKTLGLDGPTKDNAVSTIKQAAAANSFLGRAPNEIATLSLPSSINQSTSKLLPPQQQQHQANVILSSSSLQRVPPATTGVAVSSAPPPSMSRVPKLSPSDVREQQQRITFEDNSTAIDSMRGGGGGDRKRPISPTAVKQIGSLAAKKPMHSSEQLSGSHSSVDNGRLNIPVSRNKISSNSSGAISNAQMQLAAPNSTTASTANMQHSVVSTSKGQLGTNGVAPQLGTQPSPPENGKNGLGGSGGGGSYQMQKPFSDNYVPKHYRPQPMLKQSSKKDEHGSAPGNGSQNTTSSHLSSSGKIKHPAPSVPKENGFAHGKESTKENKDTNQAPIVVSKHHNVSKTSPVSNNTPVTHTKPIVHEVAKS